MELGFRDRFATKLPHAVVNLKASPAFRVPRKIGSSTTPSNDDALKKVAATFDAAMSRAVSGFKEAAHPGNFKVLAVTDNTKDKKIADVKATGDQEAIKTLVLPEYFLPNGTGRALLTMGALCF